MTRVYPNAAERAALAVICRHCGALPGRWCTTLWTNAPFGPAAALHGVRYQDAADEGTLPIAVGEK